jgi:lysophospholipase L1-like esterase
MKQIYLLAIITGFGLVLGLPGQAAPIKVACIGDSITEGANVDSPLVNAYPVVLGRLLGTNYATRNFGVSGRTLLRKGDFPYWNEADFRNATNYAPDIVTIKLGTNDSKPQNWRYKDQFIVDLRSLVDVFANLPSHPKIYLCLPVPAYSITFDINPDIIKNEIIPIIKQVAKEKGLQTIDLFSVFSGKKDLITDDIHPNTPGSALIARTIHAAIISSRTP